jgi:hypothetical protein
MSKDKNIEVMMLTDVGTRYKNGEQYVVLPAFADALCGSKPPKAVRLRKTDKLTYAEELMKQKVSQTIKPKEEKPKPEPKKENKG